MDKKDILANLYAIKTGMAAISVEKEKLDQKQVVVDQKTQDFTANLNKQDELEDLILSDESKINGGNKAIETAKQTLEGQKKGIKDGEKNNSNAIFNVWKKSSTGIFLCVFLIIASIVMLVNYVKKATSNFGDVMDDMFTLIIAATIFAISFIVLIVVCQKASKEANQIKKSGDYYKSQQMSMAKSNYNNTIKSQTNFLDTVKQDKQNHQSQLEALKTQLPVLQDKLNSAKQAYALTEEVVLPVSNAIYEAMLNKYGEFLDEREWGIVDLLIYYFETGRADTLKEALLHADQQRALQKIVEAVLMANENICQTMDRSLRNLGDRLTCSISMLQVEIINQADRIVGSNMETAKSIARSQTALMSEIKSSMEAVSSSISSSVSSLQGSMSSNANTQTELMKQMRNDSNTLAQNVRYMTTKTYGSSF